LPDSAPLQVLSIGNLALAFVPAEPYATVGGTLASAVRRGDARTVFVVAFANGYHGLLPSRDLLGAPGPEGLAHFYGPLATDALARSLAALSSNESEPSPTAEPVETPIAGGSVLVLNGDARVRGLQRGNRYGASLVEYFQSSVTPRLEDGEAAPDEAPWSLAPRFMNLTPFLLPHEANKVRPWIGSFTTTLVDEVAGIAEATGMSFDATWLSVCAQQACTDTPAPRTFPMRTPEGGMLLGILAPWAHPDQPPVVHVQTEGLDYLQVASGWTPGVAAGLNEAGLVVWCDAPAEETEPAAFTMPVGCAARDALLSATTIEEAGAVLAASPENLRRVRVADANLPGGEADDAAESRFAGLPPITDRAALEAHLRQQAMNSPFLIGDTAVGVCAAILDPSARTAYLSFTAPGEAMGDFSPYEVGGQP
jgi:hypothetical protein